MGERYVLWGELGTHTPATEIRFYAFPIFTDGIHGASVSDEKNGHLLFAVRGQCPFIQFVKFH